MEEERRRAIRIKKELVAQYQEKGDGQNWDIAEIKDFSEIGLVMFTEKVFAADTALHFRVKVPLNPTQWYEFNGKVIACDKHRVRVAITEIGSDTLVIIREFVAWFLKKQAPKVIDNPTQH